MFVIKGGRIIDATGERGGDVLIGEDGRIAAVGPDLSGDQVIDAGGCVVAPGLVDLHTHLREPGREEAETVETGSRAAALGGFTAVVAMPNTEPAIDSASVVREVLELGKVALCDVHVAGAITVGRQGDQLAPMAEMAALGVHMFTDDGRGVQDNRMMRRALEYASGLDITLAQHCEDESLAAGGHMHEGEWSSRLGIPGIPAEAEELVVMRDIALARLTGGHVHFQHLSTAGAIAMVRAAKGGGLPITGEVTPHHFTLTDESCAGYDPVFKVNPPLRTAADVAALRAGLVEGVIDVVATDHAPHAVQDKECEWSYARPGMLGLETALSIVVDALLEPLGWDGIAQRMSRTPARIAGLAEHGHDPAVGQPANLTLVDPTAQWSVEPSTLASRSRNTPYAGMTLTGRVVATFLRGRATVLDGKATR